MIHPIASMILRGAGRDPQTCETPKEVEQACREMAERTAEHCRYVESLRGGVPVVLASLKRTIALGQLEQMRRLAR